VQHPGECANESSVIEVSSDRKRKPEDGGIILLGIVLEFHWITWSHSKINKQTNAVAFSPRANYTD
jgi:hypothetical protein